MEVVDLAARQREEEQHRAANQRPAADGDSDSSARGVTVNDIIITSSYQLHQTAQAPPTLFYAPPTTTAVQTPVQQPQTHGHMVLQVLNPTVAPPHVSHNASVVRDKPRTVPNILSRRKTSAPPSTLIKNAVEGKTEDGTYIDIDR